MWAIMKSYEKLPKDLYVDPEARELYVPPSIQELVPGAVDYFANQNLNESDLLESLQTLESSVFNVKSGNRYVPCSLIHGDAVSKEALVIFAPFSDSEPKSSAEAVLNNALADKPKFGQKRAADSNSWNQIIKSAVTQELLAATGSDMPVLTIFSPLSLQAFDRHERCDIRGGDFSAMGRLAVDALAVGQSRLHGSQATTRIGTIHLAGASLGAHNALGAGRYMNERGSHWIGSLTAQELIIGPETVPQLAKKYLKPLTGVASQKNPPEDWIKLPEPALRSIDRNGYSPAVVARILRGMSRASFHKGIANPEEAYHAMNELYKSRIPLTVAQGENSSLTVLTPTYMPHGFSDLITVKGVKDSKAAHLINEHVTLTSMIIAMNIARARKIERRIHPRVV